MSLGPVNVKRTWEVREGGIDYRMEVELGGYERVSAQCNPGGSIAMRTLPPEMIEHDLQSKIIGHIRASLFPRK